MVLELHGHRVRVAYDGPSALHAARPDVVSLDLAMPGMEGLALASGWASCRNGQGVPRMRQWLRLV
jgi:CheY-like chemotaxis protein